MSRITSFLMGASSAALSAYKFKMPLPVVAVAALAGGIINAVIKGKQDESNSFQKSNKTFGSGDVFNESSGDVHDFNEKIKNRLSVGGGERYAAGLSKAEIMRG